MSEENENAAFLFLDLLQQTSSRVSWAIFGYIPIVELIIGEGMRLCTTIRPDPEPGAGGVGGRGWWWSVSFSHEVCGLLGEWQSSEQN